MSILPFNLYIILIHIIALKGNEVDIKGTFQYLYKLCALQ